MWCRRVAMRRQSCVKNGSERESSAHPLSATTYALLIPTHLTLDLFAETLHQDSSAQNNPAVLIMDTFYHGNRVVLEESDEATASNFSWYCPGSFVSAPKKIIRAPPGIRFNPEPCFPVTPISSVPPPSYCVTGHCSGIEPVKSKKLKASAVGANQISSNAAFKPKKSKKSSHKREKKRNVLKVSCEKKSAQIQTDITSIDLSHVPSPFCSCTGVPRKCHKWGNGRWQSTCCNSNISEYPLPKHPVRPRARVPGRKIGEKAYAELVAKLAAEGHNLSEPIDLKDHWVSHGASKFVSTE